MLHGYRAYVAVCTDAQTAVDASCASVQVDSACSNVVKSQLMPESDLHGLLHEFSDRFMDTLPEGLPPEWNIGHSIPLEPGSKSPFKHPYGMSPRELAEAKS